MELFPAIDLRGGRAVRLLRGDYDNMTVYSDAPEKTAQAFEAAGAKYLHVVDLDGAKNGGTPNFEVIRGIAGATSLSIEVGGGIRSFSAIERYLSIGVMRVILGTSAVTDPEFLKAAVSRFGGRIAVGVDMKNGIVATHGWTQLSGVSGFDFCRSMQDIGVKTVICTDISRDGAMQGIDERLYSRLCSEFSMDIIASGGVTAIEDIVKLSKTGVFGAVVGKAIYSGGIDLREAVNAARGTNQ